MQRAPRSQLKEVLAQGLDRREPGPTIDQDQGSFRVFADGERSLLDIRNALAAEFGPVPLDDVTKFFRDLEKSAAYTVGSTP